MPNLLLSFLVTTALLAGFLAAPLGLAWLLVNTPVWLFASMLAANIFGIVWAFVHEAVTDRLGR